MNNQNAANIRIVAANLSMDMGNSNAAYTDLAAARRFINDCSKAEMSGVDFDALKAAEARHDAMTRAEINAKWAVEAAERGI